MAGSYWCAECFFPADPGLENPDWACWSCGGPVTSQPQMWYWNNLPFRQRLDERLRQVREGDVVRFSSRPGVRFAFGAAADYLLLSEGIS